MRVGIGVHTQPRSGSLFEALGYGPSFAEHLVATHDAKLEAVAGVFERFTSAVTPDFMRSVLPVAAAYCPVVSPSMQPRLVPATYARARSFDFGPRAMSSAAVVEAARGWSGPRLERLYAQNPLVRQRLEMELAGRILPFQGDAARIRLEIVSPGAIAVAGLGGASMPVLQSLAGMNHAALVLGLPVSGQSQSETMKALLGHAIAQRFAGPPAGAGTRQYQAGRHESITDIWSDTSLTVEDKTVLMLMMIMKKMDKEIEEQSKYIESIQNQSKQGGKGKGKGKGKGIGKGKGGGGGGGNSPSVDVETMKLKRLIDKRSQMFDMLRQIVDKYNETAKGVIQSIGR